MQTRTRTTTEGAQEAARAVRLNVNRAMAHHHLSVHLHSTHNTRIPRIYRYYGKTFDTLVSDTTVALVRSITLVPMFHYVISHPVPVAQTLR